MQLHESVAFVSQTKKNTFSDQLIAHKTISFLWDVNEDMPKPLLNN